MTLRTFAKWCFTNLHPVTFETFYQQDLEPFFNSRSFFHVTHIEVLEPKHRNKKKKEMQHMRAPAGGPQIIPLSRYTSLASSFSVCSKQQTNAVIVVVGEEITGT